MKALVRSVLHRIASPDPLARWKGTREALGRVGDPDPEKAVDALLRAAEHPDLRASRTAWIPALLESARPGFGASALHELATRYRQTRHRALDPARLPTLPRVLACSDFLARVLLRHPHWAEELAGDPPGAPSGTPPEADWTSIRIAKYRGLLRIAARDLAGRPFAASLRELADLADGCLRAALACAERETGVEAPVLLALGKLGGRELNFSSDVDLLFVYETRPGMDELARNAEVTRLVQLFKRRLEVASEDGFGYRVDLDLRPEGRQGVLVNSIEAALSYYESFGEEWERQMLLRLRHVAGPNHGAALFTQQLDPFVYRRAIDPGAIERVREMKHRIERERRSSGRDLENDLKEGPGGIRDVEFLVQALQLFHGGRHRTLRGGSIVELLPKLSELALLPARSAAALREAYLWLRRAEHCVQMVEERQTHRFPHDQHAQLALARRMGYREADASQARERLLRDRERVRAGVRESFDSLVLASGGEQVLRRRVQIELEGTPLAARFERSAAPFLEARSADDAIHELAGPALHGMARVLASQPDAARYLSHRPTLLERLVRIGPETLEQRAHELERAPAVSLGSDLELFLDRMRLIRWDETYLAACVDLAALVPFEPVSRFHSILAETCLRWALEAALKAAEPQSPVSVLGMGRLAGRELTYFSDLDLIFLYPDRRGEAARAARVAQRVIHYLSTPTGAGIAYTVDSRLRPSGRQGTLVSSFEAFARYQRERAAPWEHLALMRARAVAGEVEAAQHLLRDVRETVRRGRSGAPWAAIAEIRERVERERGSESGEAVALKTGRGGMMDLDFLAAGGLLERPERPDGESRSLPDLLRTVATGPQVEALIEAYGLLRHVEARARWVSARAIEKVPMKGSAAELIAELVEPGLAAAALRAKVQAARDRIRSSFDAVLRSGTIEALER
ncbi:MAG: hypothetical protein ACE5FG_10180 [Myxococcota bacterium]